ncbi:hypothetical protein HDU90_002156 [Geranomyces variabilis]|nr:hypothetical protein HDU90_002156 [Geranomyces variabilis]
MIVKFSILAILFTLFTNALAGPAAVVACITACNAGVVICYSGLGFVFGTVTFGIAAPAAAVTCSAAQGACMAACAPLVIAPTP